MADKAYTDADRSRAQALRAQVKSGAMTPAQAAAEFRGKQVPASAAARPNVSRDTVVDTASAARLPAPYRTAYDLMTKYGRKPTTFEVKTWGDAIRGGTQSALNLEAELKGLVTYRKLDDGSFAKVYSKKGFEFVGKDIGKGTKRGATVFVEGDARDFKGDRYSVGGYTKDGYTVFIGQGSEKRGALGQVARLAGAGEGTQRAFDRAAGHVSGYMFDPVGAFAGAPASILGGTAGYEANMADTRRMYHEGWGLSEKDTLNMQTKVAPAVGKVVSAVVGGILTSGPGGAAAVAAIQTGAEQYAQSARGVKTNWRDFGVNLAVNMATAAIPASGMGSFQKAASLGAVGAGGAALRGASGKDIFREGAVSAIGSYIGSEFAPRAGGAVAASTGSVAAGRVVSAASSPIGSYLAGRALGDKRDWRDVAPAIAAQIAAGVATGAGTRRPAPEAGWGAWSGWGVGPYGPIPEARRNYQRNINLRSDTNLRGLVQTGHINLPIASAVSGRPLSLSVSAVEASRYGGRVPSTRQGNYISMR